MVLCGEACIAEIAVGLPPVLDAAIVEQPQVFCNDKRYLSALQTLPAKQQAPHTTIPVLERMDTFKFHVEVQNIIEPHLLERVIIGKQSFHVAVNIFGCNRLLFAYLVGKAFVLAHFEPRFAAVGGIRFQNGVQSFDMCLGDFIRRVVDDIVDTTEVVHRFHDIIDGRVFGRDTKCIGLEDKACLLFGKFAAFDMIGVVGEINLRTMVDSALQFGVFLLAQTAE